VEAILRALDGSASSGSSAGGAGRQTAGAGA
jgi:hypothetical protein